MHIMFRISFQLDDNYFVIFRFQVDCVVILMLLTLKLDTVIFTSVIFLSVHVTLRNV